MFLTVEVNISSEARSVVSFCQKFYIACVESFSLFFVFSLSNFEAIEGNKYSKTEKHTKKRQKSKTKLRLREFKFLSSFLLDLSKVFLTL